MKSTFEKIKWILKQARASLFLLFIIIFIAGVSSLLVVYRAILTKEIIDTASTHTNYDKFIFFIFLFIALLVFNVVINGVSSALAVRCSTSICNNMQKNLFSRLIYTKWSDFSKYHSGDILTRMTSDIDAVTRTIVSLVPSLIQLSVMIIASFITLLAYNPELAIITLCLTPVSIVLFRLFGKRLKKLYMELQTVESKYRSFLNESIQNIVIIKSFCLEKDSLEKINTIQKQKLNLTLKRNKMGIISNSIFDIVSWIAMGIALIVGSISIFNGTSSYGTLTATIQLVGGIQGPFSALAATIPMLISAIGSSERIIEFEELNLDSQTAIDCDMKSVGLNIENVNFSYNINSPILTNCHATIYPGEIVAFIGPSGQGKTTLVRLMLSLVEADSGKIFITNKNQKY